MAHIILYGPYCSKKEKNIFEIKLKYFNFLPLMPADGLCACITESLRPISIFPTFLFYSKRSEYDKLEINGLHRDHPRAWE